MYKCFEINLHVEECMLFEYQERIVLNFNLHFAHELDHREGDEVNRHWGLDTCVARTTSYGLQTGRT